MCKKDDVLVNFRRFTKDKTTVIEGFLRQDNKRIKLVLRTNIIELLEQINFKKTHYLLDLAKERLLKNNIETDLNILLELQNKLEQLAHPRIQNQLSIKVVK